MKRALCPILVVLASLFATPGHALDEAIGRALFRRAWVPAPSSTKANAGLGPLFNARSCAACHKDLARQPVATDAVGQVESDNIALRFSDAAGAPDPVYGRQMQPSAVTGTEPEGHAVLRGGRYEASGLAYGPLAEGARTGALLAPSLRGLGLLDTIPDAVIAAGAERQGEGISGRVNWIAGPDGRKRAGRFGWKASAATLNAQVETAFLLDLGLSTPGRLQAAGDCTAAQRTCLQAPHGGQNGGPEIPDEIVSRVAAYLASIPPDEPEAVDHKGRALFAAAGCASCHVPSLPGAGGPVRAFSDLLLHDMGPTLDGGATEPGVASTEWRTAPLWGLSRTLANGAGLLHDGRATTIEDAIKLHGGEAAGSRARFDTLALAERRRLIDFLKSL
ncbi:di-heme oxidoredictase family protein [Microvirga pudoricolor]|uniref:di-heme oxidoredictase family protein n=1 Tax=Microvirga pudoricolor TaxID=2778729 RepID=UPI001951FCA0|nr:di-heme oxidoredictase family protein [Microvirga pudoricolor]MBM6593336.1 c-type cytochrome [Microvirga pudoricolor]